MGLLDKIRGKRDDGLKELRDGIAHSFAATSNQPSASDSEMRRGLDIDIHTIEDQGLTSVLDRLCEGIPYHEQQYDADGKPLVAPVADEKGKVTHMVPVVATHYHFLPWAPALRVAVSKVFATRFMDDYDVETYKIKLRNEFAKIKRTMNREDREAFTPLINLLLIYCETALDDARDGKKMLALKVQRKDLTVGLTTGKRRP